MSDIKRLAVEAQIDKPYMDAAIKAVEVDIISELKDTPAYDYERVKHLHARLVLLMEVSNSITKIIADGAHEAYLEQSPGQ